MEGNVEGNVLNNVLNNFLKNAFKMLKGGIYKKEAEKKSCRERKTANKTKRKQNRYASKDMIFRAFCRAYENFPHRIKKPELLVMGKKQFVKYLSDSPLDINSEFTPSLIAHTPDKDTIIFCPEIIEYVLKRAGIRNAKKFIEALAMHELYHEWNRHRIESKMDALESEAEVDMEMKTDFPDLYRVMVRASKNL